MTDFNTLIRDLEAPPQDMPEYEPWNRVNNFAYEQGWYECERFELNEYLIDEAFRLGDKNILIAVALSLVPEGWEWSVSRLYLNDRHYARVANDGLAGEPSFVVDKRTTSPAHVLSIAALKARAHATSDK